MSKLLVKNIGMLATPLGSDAKRGAEQGRICVLCDAWVLTGDALILKTGTGEPPEADVVIDAEGCLVTPGLVDAHTHLVFAGWRQNELGKKLHGASYLDILREGGGILSTVRHTRAASEEELIGLGLVHLDEMLSGGTTTCEVKSGYGLSTEQELKQLRVIRAMDEKHPMDIAATFMGAHAVPEEYLDDRDGYVNLICDEMLPAVKEQGIARYCDIFCETGAFSVAQTKKIADAAKQFGLKIKIHADEIDAIGGSVLAGEEKAISAEHLIVLNEEGMDAMAAGGTIGCLLPATSLYLNATYAPARKMIGKGIAVALSTDFNPGSCPSTNLQLVINLASLKYRMTPEEVLTGVTLNGAATIGLAETVGSIEEGKQADIVIWNAPDLDYLCYRMGSNLVRTVIKKGSPVVGGYKR